MEPDFSNPSPGQSVFESLSVSHDGGNYLGESARWCRFLAILGLVCLGIMLLAFVLAGQYTVTAFGQLVPGLNSAMVGGLIFAVIAFVMAFFGLMLFLLLRFANYTRKALQMRNQEMFIKGMAALKLYFIIYGVLAVLGLIGNALSIFK